MFLLFDIGGTRMRFATSEDGNNLSNITSFDTPKTFEDGVPIFKNYINNLGISGLEGVSGAFPGTFDNNRTALLSSKNLGGWVNKSIKKVLENELGASILLSNDANMAALGEALFGSGKGFNIVAYLTVSTGVGGSRIVGGKLDNNSLGFEPGYQIIDLDGSVDKGFLTSNQRYGNSAGYLQRLISGKDLFLKFGKSLEKISEADVWEDITKYLSIGINNVIVFWAPDIVVLGGGVAMSEYISIKKIESYLRDYLIIYAKPPIIKKAKLGDEAGLFGCLHWLKQN